MLTPTGDFVAIGKPRRGSARNQRTPTGFNFIFIFLKNPVFPSTVVPVYSSLQVEEEVLLFS